MLKSEKCFYFQNGYEKCAAEYQVRIKSLNEKSQKEELGAQPKVTYEYYDESAAAGKLDQTAGKLDQTAGT